MLKGIYDLLLWGGKLYEDRSHQRRRLEPWKSNRRGRTDRKQLPGKRLGAQERRHRCTDGHRNRRGRTAALLRIRDHHDRHHRHKQLQHRKHLSLISHTTRPPQAGIFYIGNQKSPYILGRFSNNNFVNPQDNLN